MPFDEIDFTIADSPLGRLLLAATHPDLGFDEFGGASSCPGGLKQIIENPTALPKAPARGRFRRWPVLPGTRSSAEAGEMNGYVFLAAIFATPLFGLIIDKVGRRSAAMFLPYNCTTTSRELGPTTSFSM